MICLFAGVSVKNRISSTFVVNGPDDYYCCKTDSKRVCAGLVSASRPPPVYSPQRKVPFGPQKKIQKAIRDATSGVGGGGGGASAAGSGGAASADAAGDEAPAYVCLICSERPVQAREIHMHT